jgi:dTDP-4-amino-4,6-dideoxygalactose transaminase
VADSAPSAPTPEIPFARPRLPRAAELLPYLRQIDESRWYTNRGPLLCAFERRVSDHLRAEGRGTADVAAVASGTTGLILALKAALGERGGTCLLPSWTFAATACAVPAAGLHAYFVDVDPETWLPDRRAVKDARDVVALVAMTPGGVRLDIEPWRRLAAERGLALVVDAADCFDSVQAGAEPQVVSLHACKALGVGEGGLVVSSNTATVERIRKLASFGFSQGRVSQAAGINGKMSEYAAAVGHAALDGWPETRRGWLERSQAYRGILGGGGFDLLFDGGHACASAMVDLGRPLAAEVVKALAVHGVEARRPWGDGCHRQPAFAAWPHGPLPVTEALAQRIVALPFYVDLDDAAMAKIAGVLARTLQADRAALQT